MQANQKASTPLDHHENDHTPDATNSQLEYDITDILEGLSEPISLPYSVNRPANPSCDDAESPLESPNQNNVSSSWLPSPLENDDDDDGDYKQSPQMDQTFVDAIRNELREKLPNSSTLAIVEPEEACSENANITIEYNTYPAQLSPIFEEEEFSSLSSIRSALSDEYSDTINGANSFGFDGDDVLIVNTETNEASMLERSPVSVSSRSGDKHRHKLNETYDIDENDDTIGLTDTLDSDSFPSPDSLSPGTSSKTGAQLSCSSSECGNLSDVFLSPSSSKNFDEFDLEKPTSIDDSRHLNTPENKLQTGDCQKAIFNIEQMLRKSEVGEESRSLNFVLSETDDQSIDPVRKCRDETWLKSLFTGSKEASSWIDAGTSEIGEKECWSLPPNFKSEDWPSVDELVQDISPDAKVSKSCDGIRDGCESEAKDEEGNSTLSAVDANGPVEVCSAESKIREVEETSACTDVISFKDDADVAKVKESDVVAPSSNSPASHCAKKKNSIALFGNTSKQIRNFQVSVVDEDCFRTKTSPTTSKNEAYLTERLNASTSPKCSEKTWKSSLNSFLNNQNLEILGLKEINVNDMLMSTSFIESGSREGSVDGKEDNESKSEDSDDEGVESTSEEFVWKVCRFILYY